MAVKWKKIIAERLYLGVEVYGFPLVRKTGVEKKRVLFDEVEKAPEKWGGIVDRETSDTGEIMKKESWDTEGGKEKGRPGGRGLH
jgi:hypothetical protein